MAGSISLSLDQLLNNLGEPLSGGKIYTYAAGTTTPQSAYQDASLTIVHPNPIILDSVGAVPQLYFADGYIKIRVTDSDGVTIISADYVLVVGASSGGSSAAVDATTVFSAGDVKWRYGTGVHTGWVRLAGRTIGSATSGATERANADTETLYTYLYNADTNLSVSGGRGASAAADFAANKTLTLPDARGSTVAGLDDMGNSAASVLTSTYFGTATTTLGARNTTQSTTIGAANLPTLTGTATAAPNNPLVTNGSTTSYTSTGGATLIVPIDNGSATFPVTVNSGAANTPISRIQPTILMTLYCKL